MRARVYLFCFLFLFCAERTAQLLGESNKRVTKNARKKKNNNNNNNNRIMGGRRKNPHPKRAENARTVLKVARGDREERGGEEEEEP